jgi:hypothetical protein
MMRDDWYLPWATIASSNVLHNVSNHHALIHICIKRSSSGSSSSSSSSLSAAECNVWLHCAPNWCLVVLAAQHFGALPLGECHMRQMQPYTGHG